MGISFSGWSWRRRNGWSEGAGLTRRDRQVGLSSPLPEGQDGREPAWRRGFRRKAHTGSSSDAWRLGCLEWSGHAGSWRTLPVRQCRDGRRTRLVSPFEKLDDHHAPATAGTWPRGIGGFIRDIGFCRRGDGQKRANAFEACLSAGRGKQAVMTDAMESARQDVQHEPADELAGRNCHDALPVSPLASVVLVAEGDAVLVEVDEAAIRDSDAVGVARQIGEHGLGAAEGRLGIDDPAFLSDRREMPQECSPLGQMGDSAKEGELAGIVKRDQTREK
uniref:Uncharacterized protein n=1 Tax=Magnetospirillum gryphiswaldense TaxID=55518 RepID=A0A9P1NG10_9PROT|nr:hypothetical protein MGR_P0016 [Magnetospirillum gryphiswaldense MSR-1]